MIDGKPKLILRVYLVGNKGIRIKVDGIHDNIITHEAPILMRNKEEFTIMKADYCKYTRMWLTLPTDIKDNNKTVCRYKFSSEKARYDCLKDLKNALLDFSISSIFYKSYETVREPYILYVDKYWFLY